MAGGSDIIKIGPFGNKRGDFWDGKGHSDIVQIFVGYQESLITSIQYQYVENGRLMLSELHGNACGNKFDVVKLNYPTEYITCIRGYTYANLSVRNLCSIAFGTNLGEYGPFGKYVAGVDTEFRVMLGKTRQFFGFHGTAGLSIGVYMKPNMTSDLVKKEREN